MVLKVDKLVLPVSWHSVLPNRPCQTVLASQAGISSIGQTYILELSHHLALPSVFAHKVFQAQQPLGFVERLVCVS